MNLALNYRFSPEEPRVVADPDDFLPDLDLPYEKTVSGSRYGSCSA
jgi:hypothetical protein